MVRKARKCRFLTFSPTDFVARLRTSPTHFVGQGSERFCRDSVFHPRFLSESLRTSPTVFVATESVLGTRILSGTYRTSPTVFGSDLPYIAHAKIRLAIKGQPPFLSRYSVHYPRQKPRPIRHRRSVDNSGDSLGICQRAPYNAHRIPYIAHDIPYITHDIPYIAHKASSQGHGIAG